MTTAIERTEQESLAAENARLAEAQQTIDEIHTRRAERQRAADIKLLQEARNELFERTRFFESNAPIYRQQMMDFENGRNHLLTARRDVDESKRHQPTIAAYLPGDREVLRWEKNHDRLLERMREAQAAFDGLPDPEALRQGLSAAQQQITTLTYSVQNIERKLEGWSAKSWLEGGSGVSAVGGDGALPSTGKAWIR